MKSVDIYKFFYILFTVNNIKFIIFSNTMIGTIIYTMDEPCLLLSKLIYVMLSIIIFFCYNIIGFEKNLQMCFNTELW